jgi:O-antigen/teichoic acid export membrane protein
MKEKSSYLFAKLSGQSLKSRCARSGAVLGIGAVVAKILGFGSKVVLTRLLVPQDMGLMVMLLSITDFFETTTEVGVKQSVIQHKNGAELDYLKTAWLVQTLRAVLLYAIAYILAPFVCEFYFRTKAEVLTRYSIAELTTLVRVTFLSVLFNGFISPRAHVLEKQFKFGKAVIISQGGFALGTIITIILVFITRNVWAIVIGFASINFFKCLMSHIICPFMPRFAYHKKSFQELSRFARGMFGLPIMTYIAFNLDVLVAGKLVSISSIGLYGMARVLAALPRDLFSQIVTPVLFPAFAEKQDDKKALCEAVLRITKAVALFLIPVAVLAIICGKVLLSIVWGAQFGPAAVQFGLLCGCVLILTEGNVLGSLFFGIGQPGKHRAFVALRVIIMALLIYPGVKFFGLSGAAAVVLIANLGAMCLQVVVVHKIIGLSIFDYAVSWLPGLILAIPVLAITGLVQVLKPDLPMFHLGVGIGVLLCTFIGVAVSGSRKFFGGPWSHSAKVAPVAELIVQEESEGV